MMGAWLVPAFGIHYFLGAAAYWPGAFESLLKTAWAIQKVVAPKIKTVGAISGSNRATRVAPLPRTRAATGNGRTMPGVVVRKYHNSFNELFQCFP